MPHHTSLPFPHRAALAGIAALALSLALPAPLAAGPINPPAGSVSSTHKTLTEVEPRTPISFANTPGNATNQFRITQPGSYYLTANITGRADMNGIEIAAGNVTLDLMGFTLQGVANSLTGIVSDGSHSNITIRGGIVTGWGSDGIDLTSGGAGTGSLIENIQSTNNVLIGIRARPHSIVRSCIADANGNAGITAAQHSMVINSTGRNNGASGISVGVGGVVSDCTAQGNGVYGISVGNGGTVRGSTAVGNNSGIIAGSTAAVVNCAAQSNTGFGIFASSGASVTACSATLNGGDGFVLEGASAFDCRAHQNTGVGFDASFGAILSRCTAATNALDGFTLAGNCTAIDCSSRANGQSGVSAGILVTGSDNRIEGNNHTANDVGIRVTGAGNLIIHNACSGNTTANYDIAADNRYGPIVNITAAGAPAVLGNAGADSTTTTHPWANFAY